MKIHIAVEADDCPYWDYASHTPSHTCGSCECLWEGNNIHNVHLGVMIGKDRYCLLGSKIYPKILESIEQNEED